MNRKKIFPALLVCIILFAAALVATSYISKGGAAQTPDGTPVQVVLNEILPGNRTYPAPDGSYPDYIELKNISASAVDISGYMLSDKSDSIGYTFPQGTILPAGGCVVCWCASDSTVYANFGISRGGETVYLYNSSNVVIDKIETPVIPTNYSYARQPDGSWTQMSQVTPGYDNNPDGYDQWLETVNAHSFTIRISEVFPASKLVALDGHGSVCDWIELYNYGKETVVLDGAYLSDDPEDPLKWQIDTLSIAPGQYVIIRCTGTAGILEASFAMPRSGCTVTLSSPMGNVISAVEVPQLGDDCSWAIGADGDFAVCDSASPGFENTQEGYRMWLSQVGITEVPVIISEIMASNRSTVLSGSGSFCDWIELYNPGSTDAVLTGAYLSDDPEDRSKWRFPDLTLAPGQRVVICCAGDYAQENEADFSLSASGGTVSLTLPTGYIAAQVTYPTLESDRVYAIQNDGSYLVTDLPSPGYENTEEGASAYRATQIPHSGLIISEVMSANTKYLLQSDGEYHDWIELYNQSDVPIDLSDYCLSDNPGSSGQLALPEVTLQPGEYVVVICSGNTSLKGRYIQAPFTLSRDECWVYLRHANGQLADYLRISGVPGDCSAGRPDGGYGMVYFTAPTPAAPNGAGVAYISGTPVAVTPDGIYNDVESVNVTFEGTSLRYTTDGSVPTANSTAYTGPISLKKTTVIRIASFEEGKIPSDTLSVSYIINENHTLPVLSLAAKPSEMFGANGIYVRYHRDMEIPCNLTFYENGGGFSIDCGLEMFGHTALELEKKGFKVNFRGRYGEDYLGYPVYGEDGPQIFDALCIRAGQDYPQAIFRDELFTSLCMEFSDSALAQRHKFCILYINGEYWGIYALKEAFCETYYAQNKGVSEESVEILQAPGDYDTELYHLSRFGIRNDLSNAENYAELAAWVDMDSLADWMVMQGYSVNNDVEQNLRYFRSTENGNLLQLAFYDQDWAFYYHQELDNILDSSRTRQYLNLTRSVVENPVFREKLLQRFSDAYHGVLSDEHVLQRIDEFVELLSPEVNRERSRWNSTYTMWERDIRIIREFIGDGYHWRQIIGKLKIYLGLTEAEVQKYFGG